MRHKLDILPCVPWFRKRQLQRFGRPRMLSACRSWLLPFGSAGGEPINKPLHDLDCFRPQTRIAPDRRSVAVGMNRHPPAAIIFNRNSLAWHRQPFPSKTRRCGSGMGNGSPDLPKNLSTSGASGRILGACSGSAACIRAIFRSAARARPRAIPRKAIKAGCIKTFSPQRHRGTERNLKRSLVLYLCVSVPLW